MHLSKKAEDIERKEPLVPFFCKNNGMDVDSKDCLMELNMEVYYGAL